MGTPDTCIAKIKQLREVMGTDHFNANFWFGDLSQEQVLGSMELLGAGRGAARDEVGRDLNLAHRDRSAHKFLRHTRGKETFA